MQIIRVLTWIVNLELEVCVRVSAVQSTVFTSVDNLQHAQLCCLCLSYPHTYCVLLVRARCWLIVIPISNSLKVNSTHTHTWFFFLPVPASQGKGLVSCTDVKVCTSLTSTVRIMHPVLSYRQPAPNFSHWLNLIDFLSLSPLSLSLQPDLLNGAQEKCELPPLEGFPHCEGKLKVNHTHWLTNTSHLHVCVSLWRRSLICEQARTR